MEARRPELRNRGGGAPGPGSSAVRPCYSGSRCFIGISLGLALVEGLPAAAGARSVPGRLMRAPSVERGGGEDGWADGLTAGALRAGPEPPTKNFRRAAPGAGLGRFHCHGRELKQAAFGWKAQWREGLGFDRQGSGRVGHAALPSGLPRRLHQGETVIDPRNGEIIVQVSPLSEKKLYPKERALIDLVAADRMEGRRVLVYATHTGTRDITGWMDDILT